jgi:hypothetical protein
MSVNVRVIYRMTGKKRPQMCGRVLNGPLVPSLLPRSSLSSFFCMCTLLLFIPCFLPFKRMVESFWRSRKDVVKEYILVINLVAYPTNYLVLQ